MKLMYIIVRQDNEEDVTTALIKKNFRITKLSTSGGFLKKGNTTLMSCVEDNCGVVINSKDNKKSNEKNNYGENVKIVEKETKVVEQPVYVVNRIINIDEDMNLTDEELNQIVIGKDGKATVVNSNNKNKKIVKKRNSSSSDRFKQQYDIIEANNMSYGEVAFVDDYND